MRAILGAVVVLVAGCGSAEAPGWESGGGATSVAATGGAAGSGGAGAASGGLGGAAACTDTECTTYTDCCAGFACIGVPGASACHRYCNDDSACPSGLRCVQNGRGCGIVTPAMACTQDNWETTCETTCETDADCNGGCCIRFIGQAPWNLGVDTCPAPSIHVCAYQQNLCANRDPNCP